MVATKVESMIASKINEIKAEKEELEEYAQYLKEDGSAVQENNNNSKKVVRPVKRLKAKE